ncbi:MULTISPECIES: hypothetical protein [Brevibacillus]|uniref:hypothetical protein n=1 Tax=Brevibacillus TaxID=55080 RepID=UPI000E2FB067|nr:MULTISPECIES: hypothetical protein [Brevibacillus]MED1790626.1 hypothetical protein [Brevibacillus laterosporus]RFB35712.1 hypothetical protein DZB91_09465 [Brevibacillus sp. VP]
MIWAYVIPVILLIILCLQKLSDRSYFRGELYEVHRKLKTNLGMAGFYGSINGDNYDNALYYLKSLRLEEKELKKLSLIIKKESSRNNHSIQITTVIYSVIASVIVMVFSVLFGSTISSIFSNYSNLILTKVAEFQKKEHQEKIDSVKTALDGLVNFTLENMVLLILVLALFIYIFYLANDLRVKKSILLQAIVDEVLNDRVKE